jgi:hypothetical protein
VRTSEVAPTGIVVVIIVVAATALALAIFMDELDSLIYAPSAFGLNITKLNVTNNNDTNQTGSIAGRGGCQVC